MLIMENNKLFVGNISWNVNWQELKDVFSEYGEVAFAKIITDRETRRPKGFGFVEFVNAEDAAKAKEALDWKEVDWRELKVDFAVDKKED